MLPPKGKKVEDLCAFVKDGIIVAVMCDNNGIMAPDGGIYCEMDLGSFKQDGEVVMQIKSIAWETRPRMFPGQDFSKGKRVYFGNKFERPKVMSIDGEPSYMFLPSGFNVKGDARTVLHAFRIKGSQVDGESF